MNFNALRDLEIAGIKWELTDQCHGERKKETSATDATPKTPTAAPNNANTPIPSYAPITNEAAVNQASAATDINALLGAIGDFAHPLRQFAKNTVLPHIAQNNTSLLILTDAPGADDEESGQILSAAAGDLMDKMLAAIGLDRTSVSIVPLIFWRTPGGRTPSRDEIDLAKPFVKRAISLLKPKAILTLGTLTAAEWLDVKLPKSHGEVFKDENDMPVIPIYHPNYLILKPESKRNVWEALQKLQKLLKNDEE